MKYEAFSYEKTFKHIPKLSKPSKVQVFKGFSDKNVENILPLNIDFKIITVYDTTAVAVETKPSWTKLNKGDILRVK